MKTLDLDVDAPDKVSAVLRSAALAYGESASELEAAWGDKGAGRPWDVIARILEKAANDIDKRVDVMWKGDAKVFCPRGTSDE